MGIIYCSRTGSGRTDINCKQALACLVNVIVWGITSIIIDIQYVSFFYWWQKASERFVAGRLEAKKNPETKSRTYMYRICD